MIETDTPVEKQADKSTPLWAFGLAMAANLALAGFLLVSLNQSQKVREDLVSLKTRKEALIKESGAADAALTMLSMQRAEAEKRKIMLTAELQEIEKNVTEAHALGAQKNSLESSIEALLKKKSIIELSNIKESYKISDLEKLIEKTKVESESLEQSKNEIEKRIAALTARRDEASKEAADADGIMLQVREAKLQLKNAAAAQNEAEVKAAAIAGEIEKMKSDRDALAKELGTFDVTQRAITDRRATLTAIDAALASSSQKEASLKSIVENLTIQRDSLLKEATAAEAKLSTLRDAKASAISIQTQVDGLTGRLASLQGSVDKLSTQRSDLEKEIGTKESIRHEMIEAQAATAAARAQYDELSLKLAPLKLAVDRLTAQRDSLIKAEAATGSTTTSQK